MGRQLVRSAIVDLQDPIFGCGVMARLSRGESGRAERGVAGARVGGD